MKLVRSIGGASLIALVAAAPAPRKAVPPRVTPQQVTGPVANYWVSAGTSSGSGFGAMGQGSGARPSMGDIMRMMRGQTSTSHELVLQLGSTRTATGEPKADHLPGGGAPLPLLTPRNAPVAAAEPEETVEEQPRMPEKPKGRILLYWGCGEHAGPGQPYVIDFEKIMAGQSLPRLPFVAVHHQNPPSAGRYATYGEWPNSRSRQQRPPASLIGDHDVKGNYSPDIHFALPPGRDYMPPLVLSAQDKTPAGATRLTWQPVAGATGYFATMFGVSPDAKGNAPEIVMWSSSGVSTFAGGGLLDYLAPAEVRRLTGQRVIMPPSQTQCLIPVEVAQAGRIGTLSMIAYGEEANFADPPRPADPKLPWNINWTTKVRYKSTAGMMLGVPGMGGGAMSTPMREEPDAEPAQPAPKKKGGFLGKLKDLSDAIPR